MRWRFPPNGSRRTVNPPRVSAVMLLIFLFCSLIGFGATAFGVTEIRARTATTTGQVLDSGDTIRNGHGTLRCKDAVVTFPLEQPRYRYTGLVGDPCPQDGGPTTATLYYDPNSPGNVATSKDWVALAGFMVLAAAGAVLCAFLLALRAWTAMGEMSRRGDPSRSGASG